MAEDLRDRARKRAAERATSIWFKLKEGDNTIRLLPTPASKTTPDGFIEYAVHREVGPKKQMVRCGKDPVNHYEGDCWLCDVTIPKLRAKGNDVRADMLEAKDVCAMQIASVIESDDGVEYKGPFIFTPAATLADTMIASIFGSRKREYADPEKGYNLTISRTGTGRNDTRYSAPMPDEESSKIPKKFRGLVDKLKPFSELKEIPVYSEAKQKAAYTGQDIIADAEDEDEPAPKRRRDVEEDESDESEEAPAPRKRRTPEEDEPEPPPKKRRVPAEDEVDEPAPRKRRPEPVEEDHDKSDPDEEEPPTRPRKRAVVEEDEPDPPPKKKRPPVEEEDEPDERPKKRRYDEPIDEDSQQEADEADDPDEPEEPPRKAKAAVVSMKKKRN